MHSDGLLKQHPILLLQKQNRLQARAALPGFSDQIQARTLLEQLGGDQQTGLSFTAQGQGFLQTGAGAAETLGHPGSSSTTASALRTNPEGGEQATAGTEQDALLIQQAIQFAAGVGMPAVGLDSIHGSRPSPPVRLRLPSESCQSSGLLEAGL